jgi:hypothetical protein
MKCAKTFVVMWVWSFRSCPVHQHMSSSPTYQNKEIERQNHFIATSLRQKFQSESVKQLPSYSRQVSKTQDIQSYNLIHSSGETRFKLVTCRLIGVRTKWRFESTPIKNNISSVFLYFLYVNCILKWSSWIQYPAFKAWFDKILF